MSKRPLATIGAITLTLAVLAGCGGDSAKESSITPQPVSDRKSTRLNSSHRT